MICLLSNRHLPLSPLLLLLSLLFLSNASSPIDDQNQKFGLSCASSLPPGHESCGEGGYCYDFLDIKANSIQSGCTHSVSKCPSNGCFLRSDEQKFLCCCSHPFCNGKSPRLVKARWRMFLKGDYPGKVMQKKSPRDVSKEMLRRGEQQQGTRNETTERTTTPPEIGKLNETAATRKEPPPPSTWKTKTTKLNVTATTTTMKTTKRATSTQPNSTPKPGTTTTPKSPNKPATTTARTTIGGGDKTTGKTTQKATNQKKNPAKNVANNGETRTMTMATTTTSKPQATEMPPTINSTKHQLEMDSELGNIINNSTSKNETMSSEGIWTEGKMDLAKIGTTVMINRMGEEDTGTTARATTSTETPTTASTTISPTTKASSTALPTALMPRLNSNDNNTLADFSNERILPASSAVTDASSRSNSSATISIVQWSSSSGNRRTTRSPSPPTTQSPWQPAIPSFPWYFVALAGFLSSSAIFLLVYWAVNGCRRIFQKRLGTSRGTTRTTGEGEGQAGEPMIPMANGNGRKGGEDEGNRGEMYVVKKKANEEKMKNGGKEKRRSVLKMAKGGGFGYGQMSSKTTNESLMSQCTNSTALGGGEQKGKMAKNTDDDMEYGGGEQVTVIDPLLNQQYNGTMNK